MMVPRLARLMLQSLLALGAIQYPAHAKAAALASLAVEGRQGNAVIFFHNGECLGVTAAHVFADAVGGTLEFRSDGSYRVTLIKGDPGLDIAFFRVDGSDKSKCSYGPLAYTATSTLLNTTTQAQIRLPDFGRIGGTIVREKNGSRQLEFAPFNPRDPRLEHGLSGSTLTINNQIVGVVTIISGDQDKSAIAVSLDAIKLAFPEFFPSDAVTSRPAYDTSWIPTASSAAMSQSKAAIASALDEAEKATDFETKARLILPLAQPLPDTFEAIRNGAYYFYRTNRTGYQVRGEIKAEYTDYPKYSYGPHGLAELKDEITGFIHRGNFIDGKFRSGIRINELTPTRPLGTNRIFGTWDEKGNLTYGKWELADGRTLIGYFNGNHLAHGRILLTDGRSIDGTWSDRTYELEGPCIWWSPNGQFERGGTCKGGAIVKSFRPPPR